MQSCTVPDFLLLQAPKPVQKQVVTKLCEKLQKGHPHSGGANALNVKQNGTLRVWIVSNPFSSTEKRDKIDFVCPLCDG